MFTNRICSFLIAGLVCVTAARSAPLLYGVDTSTKGLNTIDLATGNVTFVGTLDPLATANDNRYAFPASMAIRPADQAIFVYNNYQFVGGDVVLPATGDLLRVNSTTGQATQIGPSGGNIFASLAYSSTGQLYGFGDQIFSLNDTTGSQTLLANVQQGPGTSRSIFGADFHPTTGTLFAAVIDYNDPESSELYTVDITTGALTLVGFLDSDVPGSLVFAPDGRLLLSDLSGNIFHVNTSTAALTSVVTLPSLSGTQGLGFVTAVPEPGTWALFGAGLGIIALRRRGR